MCRCVLLILRWQLFRRWVVCGRWWWCGVLLCGGDSSRVSLTGGSLCCLVSVPCAWRGRCAWRCCSWLCSSLPCMLCMHRAICAFCARVPFASPPLSCCHGSAACSCRWHVPTSLWRWRRGCCFLPRRVRWFGAPVSRFVQVASRFLPTNSVITESGCGCRAVPAGGRCSRWSVVLC